MNRAAVSIVRCKNYDTAAVEASVRRSLDLLGGIEKFIRPGSKVLIKPNILSDRPPEEGVDTHPEVLRAVGRIVKKITPHIYVGDSPGGWDVRDVGGVYEKSGIKRVCSEEGLNLIKFDKAVVIDGFPIAAIAKEVDFIISVPKMKSHSTTVLTGAVKNMFGTVVGLSKAQCHLKAPMPDKFAPIIARVFSIVKPSLSIMDGITGMEGEGPGSGTLRDFGLILASGDAVALDSVFARLVGLDPKKVHMIREAAKKGGIDDLRDIDIVGEKLQDAEIRDFKFSKTFFLLKLPRPILEIGVRAIKFYPVIDKDKCKRCGLCSKICPAKTIKLVKNGAYFVEKKECVHCFCCYEVCPYKAISLERSALAKIFLRG